jgi:putative ABC transport system permease protein
MGPNSDVAYVYIFSVVALFILLIASINFVNLSTARSVGRAREVGLRKVLGAYRLQLIRQFLVESTLTALCGLCLALPLIWLLLPVLNALSGKTLAFSPAQNPGMLLGLVALAVAVGLVAGLYPALFLSSHRPIQALKGGMKARSLRAATLFRKALVVGQFSLSVMLIVGTLIAMKQLNYLQTKNLGIDGEQVILLPTLRSPVLAQFDAFKEALLRHPRVLALTTAEDIPGMKHQTGGYRPEGFSEEQQFSRLIVHDDFATTLGIGMVAGREFQRAFPADAEDAVIINEAMVRLIGWPSSADAIGKDFDGDTVVGVTEDFHFTSLHRPVGPFVLERVADDLRSLSFSGRYVAIRIETEGLPETLDFIERQWAAFAPERPYESFFLDEALRGQYQAEATLSRVAGAFALLSVLVACLGLFGLSSFMAERRTKEIGIRKVLGASTANVVVLFSASFVGLVVLSMLVAWPVAYLLMHGWLEQFAYRTPIGWLPFAVAGGTTLLIACVTVSYHAMRASLASPARSLRYE